jgi:hypothetical protein
MHVYGSFTSVFRSVAQAIMPHACLSAPDLQSVREGLSGVTAVSGQLLMDECCVHDCTYGLEVGRDGHASIHSTDICFTECALICEGHAALKNCRVWANVATWQGCVLP